MPETMLEALLFGHKKGAFTGATEASEGFFRAADGGTLLLDEIAEMPLALQAKLLRALQEGEVVPIGSTRPIKVDVRVIACANRDLPAEVAEGRFRADLFYRLNVFPLALRPLRERRGRYRPAGFRAGAAPHPAGPAGAVDFATARWRCSGCTAGRAMSASWKTSSAARCCWPTAAAAIGAEHIVFDQPARLVDAADQRRCPNRGQGAKLSNIVQLSEARAIMETLDACGGSRVAAARAARHFRTHPALPPRRVP